MSRTIKTYKYGYYPAPKMKPYGRDADGYMGTNYAHRATNALRVVIKAAKAKTRQGNKKIINREIEDNNN